MRRQISVGTVGIVSVLVGVGAIAGGCDGRAREVATAPSTERGAPAAASTPPASTSAPDMPSTAANPAPSTTPTTSPTTTPAAPETKDTAVANVQKLPSGLIIEDLTTGTGPACPPGATVTIHYRGTLMNGTEFDSSIGGKPATFPLGSLIQGWQVGIPGMMAGGKRKLTIPYALAYGERGSPPVIPAKSDLIFEIELFSFKK